MSKRSKQLKTTKTIKLQWIASIWRHNDKNVELRRNAFKTTQNYKSNQITMTCIYLMSKHWKQPKTTNSDQITMNLHRFDVKSIKNVELRLNAFKTTLNYKSDQNTKLASISCQTIKPTQNYKSDQITMYCIELTSKRSKMLLRRFVKTYEKTKLQKLSNYDNLHRFDVKTIKNVELRRNAFKTTQNYKSDHITMNLHRFHVKTIKTTQNYKNDQITMNCIDLTS